LPAPGVPTAPKFVVLDGCCVLSNTSKCVTRRSAAPRFAIVLRLDSHLAF
jgi:hypothetical protein